MALPILLAGAAGLTAIAGIGAGWEGMDNLKEAERIAENAEDDFKKAKKKLKKKFKKTNRRLQELGELKVTIFTKNIKPLIELIRQLKAVDPSILEGFSEYFTQDELKEMDKAVTTALELENGLASGVTSGALIGFGAYGSVGLLASASTGTAISTLSGAAATNATLAWLGGGSLAAGGLGMAGGAAVLGGLVAAPAIAIGGFHIANKGEEALTEAREYETEIEVEIVKMKFAKVALKGIIKSTNQLSNALEETTKRLEKTMRKFQTEMEELGEDNLDSATIATMLQPSIIIGKSLKNMLNQPVIDEDGEAIPKMKKICKGYVEI